MALQYELVNATKSERLSLAVLPGRTKHDIAGNPAAAAIVAWYMMEHPRDRITFVTDDIGDAHPAWPLRGVTKAELERYRDVTLEVVTALVAAGILEERGRETIETVDRGRVVVRDLRNVWKSNEAPANR